MIVIVIGAGGFVGSSLVAFLKQCPEVKVLAVTRANYQHFIGVQSDVVIDASCNAKKYLADENPIGEFKLSVQHRLQTLQDFPATLQLHISSVDVYSDLTTLETTKEDARIDLGQVSNYGLHKLLAEQLVQHYAPTWLIVRLAGMVGPGLRKNPVYDILNEQPLRIHPDSEYQFMLTDEVARIIWALLKRGVNCEIFNICGKGLVSPREVAKITKREMNLSMLDATMPPRIVHINTEKIEAIVSLPNTKQSLLDFVRNTDQMRVHA